MMDHGRILALDTPARLKETIGADTMVIVSADGDLDALAARLRQDVAGVCPAVTRKGSVQLAWCAAATACCRVIDSADAPVSWFEREVTEPNL